MVFFAHQMIDIRMPSVSTSNPWSCWPKSKELHAAISPFRATTAKSHPPSDVTG